jgi:protein-disulfide isomerase
MRCEEVIEYFADHLAGTLDASVEALVSQHLGGCARCRTEFEQLSSIWSDLQHIPAPQPDSSVMQSRLTAAVAVAERENRRRTSNLSNRRFSMRQAAKPLGVIAVSILIAVSATLFFSRCGMALACPALHEAGGQISNSPTPDSTNGHVRGPADATLTLVEYGDYECPPCGSYELMVRKLMARYNQVKLEFHNFPLMSIHPDALLAATAAEAAGEQGHYWEMHDLLYASQSRWSRVPNAEAQFIDMASQIGLDTNMFKESLHSPQTKQRVLDDVARGKKLQVPGTPTFFLNGQRIQPADLNAFVDLVEHALRTAN